MTGDELSGGRISARIQIVGLWICVAPLLGLLVLEPGIDKAWPGRAAHQHSNGNNSRLASTYGFTERAVIPRHFERGCLATGACVGGVPRYVRLSTVSGFRMERWSFRLGPRGLQGCAESAAQSIADGTVNPQPSVRSAGGAVAWGTRGTSFCGCRRSDVGSKLVPRQVPLLWQSFLRRERVHDK